MCLSPARAAALSAPSQALRHGARSEAHVADSLMRVSLRVQERAYLSGLPPEAIPSVHSRAPASPS